MALSFSIVDSTVVGDQRRIVANVTLDNSYPTGGEAIAASDLGLQELRSLSVGVPVLGTRLLAWDQTNKKLLVFTAVGTEATAASDQSTVIAPIVAFGK